MIIILIYRLKYDAMNSKMKISVSGRLFPMPGINEK